MARSLKKMPSLGAEAFDRARQQGLSFVDAFREKVDANSAGEMWLLREKVRVTMRPRVHSNTL